VSELEINVKNFEHGRTARVSRAMSEWFAVLSCTALHEEFNIMSHQLDSAVNDDNLKVLGMLTNTIIKRKKSLGGIFKLYYL
jgi:hypothetical protein